MTEDEKMLERKYTEAVTSSETARMARLVGSAVVPRVQVGF